MCASAEVPRRDSVDGTNEALLHASSAGIFLLPTSTCWYSEIKHRDLCTGGRICFHSTMLRRPPSIARSGMIVCSHPLAAEAGTTILRQGGHAVEAAVAMGAVLAVVEPSASGLGGDAFVLVDDRTQNEVVAVNGSGAAPADLRRERFAGADSVPLRSAASCTVPGCVAAWYDSWKRWGRLEWAEVLTPALALAESGFPISWKMGRVNRAMDQVLLADTGLREAYVRNDRPLTTGEYCRPMTQARTLAALVEGGAAALYGGELGRDLADGCRKRGGFLALEDLAAHQTVFTNPYTSAYGSWTIYEQPLPSQGILLQILLGLNNGPFEDAIERPADELHRQCEAKKIAFALKDAFLTDPNHLPVPEEQLTAALLDEEVHRRLRRLLDGQATPPQSVAAATIDALRGAPAGRELVAAYESAGFNPTSPPRSGSGATDTTYLCAADAAGNRVGLIQSVFHPYGSGFQEPNTGILLNNRACGFSLDPKHINTLEPGKRSLHTLNSYMVARDAGVWLVGGTPGGDNQVQTNLQILRHLYAGLDLWSGPMPQNRGNWTQQRKSRMLRDRPSEYEALAVALESPRWRVDADGATVRIESRMPAAIRKALGDRGHDVVRLGPWGGSGLAQLLATVSMDEDFVFVGATDPRGEGVALGI